MAVVVSIFRDGLPFEQHGEYMFDRFILPETSNIIDHCRFSCTRDGWECTKISLVRRDLPNFTVWLKNDVYNNFEIEENNVFVCYFNLINDL